MDPDTAVQVGLSVRTSHHGEEKTLLYFDAAINQLVFDAVESGTRGRLVKEAAPFCLREAEPLKLRVFIDRSMIEVYANDRQAITRRVYPDRADSLGVHLYCAGGTAMESVIARLELAAVCSRDMDAEWMMPGAPGRIVYNEGYISEDDTWNPFDESANAMQSALHVCLGQQRAR